MSLTQTFVSGGALLAVMQAAWLAMAPPPPPIVVNSLTYDAGYIIQDRTVKQPSWVAEWKAEIVEYKSGAVVDNCSGAGFWNYPGGNIKPRMLITEWVGNVRCELPPGEYFPRATYSDGSFNAVHRGDVFEVTE